MVSPQNVVDYLNSLRGTPYQHQGRYHVSGRVDCIGLPLAACKEFGLSDYDNTEYSQQAYGYKIIELCDEFCTPINEFELGCLLVFKIRVKPQHMGVWIGGNQMLHSATGKVVQSATLDAKWIARLVAKYRLPGIN